MDNFNEILYNISIYYCPIVWIYCQRKSNNLINRIHQRALRIAYNDYVSDFNHLIAKDDYVTIHRNNIYHNTIQALAIEIYETMKNLNPVFMKEISSLKPHDYLKNAKSCLP